MALSAVYTSTTVTIYNLQMYVTYSIFNVCLLLSEYIIIIIIIIGCIRPKWPFDPKAATPFHASSTDEKQKDTQE